MQVELQNHSQDEDAAILSAIDVLVQSRRLLILGSLVAGLIAVVGSFAWPKKYESTAVLRMGEYESALFFVAPVLDVVISEIPELNKLDKTQDERRNQLKERISLSYDPKAKLLTAKFRGETPELAQRIGTSTIKAVLVENLPRGVNRAVMEETIDVNIKFIDIAEDMILRMKAGMDGKQKDPMQAVYFSNLALLSAEMNAKRVANIQLKRELGLMPEAVTVWQCAGVFWFSCPQIPTADSRRWPDHVNSSRNHPLLYDHP